ncbi:interferon-inducible GTPase-domain-containing protein [Kalaharituber pfeilii]|nr:interferon-inducible GTPase-domain-containing protein [Kalaharituber pfeilii]
MERERQAQLRHMQEEQQRQREEAERRERERQAQLERERRAQQQRLQEERRRIEEAERRERERQAQLQAEIRRKEEAARAELQRRQEEIAREKAEQERMRAEMQRKAEEEQAELQRRHEEELKVQKEEQERKQAELKREEEEQKAIEELMRLKLEEGEQLILENARLITKGICPNLLPTEEEWEKARARLVGGKEKFHCAIAGTSGAGKSSLVNALRGISNRHANAAKVGVVETTTEITAYPDPSTTSARSQWVWYDVPGAGTLSIPGPQYFNSQGLFVFDLVIVVVDNRFTAQDIAILHQCKQFKIPSFIVRSKANQYISNIMHQELGYPMDETEEYTTEDTLTRDSRTETLEKSKQILITNTQENFKKNLEEAELDSSQRVYIVCAQSIRAVVTMEPGAQLKKADYLIDDMQLMEDLDKAVEKRS